MRSGQTLFSLRFEPNIPRFSDINFNKLVCLLSNKLSPYLTLYDGRIFEINIQYLATICGEIIGTFFFYL